MNETLEQAKTDPSSVPEMSPEQIREMREKRSQFYKEQIAYLEPQVEYYELVSRIETAKASTAEAQLKQAQIYLAMNPRQNAPDARSGKRGGQKKGSTPAMAA